MRHWGSMCLTEAGCTLMNDTCIEKENAWSQSIAKKCTTKAQEKPRHGWSMRSLCSRMVVLCKRLDCTSCTRLHQPARPQAPYALSICFHWFATSSSNKDVVVRTKMAHLRINCAQFPKAVLDGNKGGAVHEHLPP